MVLGTNHNYREKTETKLHSNVPKVTVDVRHFCSPFIVRVVSLICRCTRCLSSVARHFRISIYSTVDSYCFSDRLVTVFTLETSHEYSPIAHPTISNVLWHTICPLQRIECHSMQTNHVNSQCEADQMKPRVLRLFLHSVEPVVVAAQCGPCERPNAEL